MGYKRKIVVDDKAITEGAGLTLRQSLIPCGLGMCNTYRHSSQPYKKAIDRGTNLLVVTILFFLWGFAYGLLDVLNSHFRTLLDITPAKVTGLSAAYFGAYFLCPLTISGWILRRYGFRVTFMTGQSISPHIYYI